MIYSWDGQRYRKIMGIDELDAPRLSKDEDIGNDVYLEGVNNEPKANFRYLYDLRDVCNVDIVRHPTRSKADAVAHKKSKVEWWHEIIETGRYWVYRRYK